MYVLVRYGGEGEREIFKDGVVSFRVLIISAVRGSNRKERCTAQRANNVQPTYSLGDLKKATKREQGRAGHVYYIIHVIHDVQKYQKKNHHNALCSRLL